MFLSIVIPVYNIPENFLRECIESCTFQDIDYNDYEIICIDDGSTNNCLSILQEYESKFANITVLSQANAGVSSARNAGMEIAKGEYLWFVDADDFIAKNSLRKLKSIICKNSVDRLCFGTYRFNGVLSISEQNEYSTGMLKSNCKLRSVSPWQSLYRRAFLATNGIKFRTDMKLSEDQIFNFMIDQIEHSEFVISDICYFYRILSNSSSHSANKELFAKKFIESHLIGCNLVKSYYDNDKIKKLTTIRYLHCDLEQIMIQISCLEHKEAKMHLKDILNKDLLPYKKWISKNGLLTIYTNSYSFLLEYICRLSTVKPLFGVIRLYAKVWSSKTKKKIEKCIKKKLS